MSESFAVKDTTTNQAQQPKTVGQAVEHAKRAFALKKFDQAVDFYATALELAVAQYGDSHLQVADLYFLYGKALLEHAISQNSVLGKDQPAAEDVEENLAPNSLGGPILSFSGDADEDDPTVDLFANPPEDAENEEEDDSREGGDDDDDVDAEPEDDFNAAWEILDLARNIYDKERNAGNADQELLKKLADTYITLGDVSLETEKFDQAITDYQDGLALKQELHPSSSRHIAEAHYKLSIVLDMTPGRLSDAIHHVEKALGSVTQRLEEMQRHIRSDNADQQHAPNQPDVKGKGKASAAFELRDDTVQSMSRAQVESEIKDLTELKEDLVLKIEELKTTPNEASKMSAPAMAQQVLDNELNTSSPSSSVTANVPVNDLTSMVVKKKKVQDPNGTKRKAEADVQPETVKKARSDGETQ